MNYESNLLEIIAVISSRKRENSANTSRIPRDLMHPIYSLLLAIANYSHFYYTTTYLNEDNLLAKPSTRVVETSRRL